PAEAAVDGDRHRHADRRAKAIPDVLGRGHITATSGPPRSSLHLRVLDGRAASPLKPVSGGPALRCRASVDALLAPPPLPWLRPPMPRIWRRNSEAAH